MVMSNKSTYEDFGLQRLVENKKRMENHKLTHLALTLKISSTKPSPAKQAKKFTQVRRSNRIANKPPPFSKEVPVVHFERNTTKKAEQLESTLSNAFVKPMVMAKNSTYEDVRLQRMEENKKRMEDLKLLHLSLTLKNSSTKPSQVKQAKPRPIQQKQEVVEVRRSNRVANNPPPVYELPVRRFESTKRYYNPRDQSYPVAWENAIEKAEELESALGNDFPTFVRPILRSHVNRGFLGLPAPFCKTNLPKRDKAITLIDEDGELFLTNYIALSTRLGDGWKLFVVTHDLVDGDVCVFQLLNPTRFKVYIIRVNGSK